MRRFYHVTGKFANRIEVQVNVVATSPREAMRLGLRHLQVTELPKAKARPVVTITSRPGFYRKRRAQLKRNFRKQRRAA